MKNIILMLMIVVFSRQLSAQNVAINNTAATADASAMLDVSSTSKGLLIPRMSTTAINLIINPAKGLLVYDSVINRLMVNMGTPATPTWQNIALSGGWSLTGNSGTNSSNNFLGTTDTKPLSFRVNNVNAGFIDNSTSGIVAFGYQSLLANTTGFGNTGHGYNSLTANTTASRNTAIGFYSLFTNNADNNTAIGTYSLAVNTTGSGNTAAGVNSLVSNIQGNNNSAFGTNTLYTNTSGTENTANGYGALFSNTTGNNNSALGSYAMYLNQTGYSNIAIGASALFNNTNRSNLVAIGDSALYNNGIGATLAYDAIANMAIGSKALFKNNIGFFNTAIGYNALYSNTSGNDNTAIGYNALYYNTTGLFNTAIGNNALLNNKDGNFNTANGNYALASNTNGYYNTANGYYALAYNSTGTGNTANGYYALIFSTAYYNTANGYKALNANTSGDWNSAFGSNALKSNTIGYGNSALGYDTDVSANNLNNVTAIGFGATVTASNKMQLGNTITSTIATSGGYTIVSDARFKDNIDDSAPGLGFITQLHPVAYNFNYKRFDDFINKNRKERITDAYYQNKLIEKTAHREIGFIAQEVEKLCIDSNFVFNGVYKPQNETDNYGLDYSKFVVPLVKAVQEQQQQIEALKKENAEIKDQLKKLMETILKK